MAEDKPETPPYVAWKTFLSATDQLQGSLPSRLDGSVFPTRDGSTKSWLLATFRFLEFTEPDGTVREPLKTWVTQPDQRPQVMRAALEAKYSDLLELANANGTPKQMQDAFSDMSVRGDTLRKAAGFFLHACAFADVEVPPTWVPPRATNANSSKRSTIRKRQPRATAEPQDYKNEASTQDAADTDTMTLESGGTVTLSVATNMVRLTPDDRDWLFRLIDHFRSYQGNQDGEDEADDE